MLWLGCGESNLAAMTLDRLSEGHVEEHHGPEGESAPSTPGWVTVLVIIVVILVVTGFVVLHLTGVLGPEAH
jgi:hypothetical protein